MDDLGLQLLNRTLAHPLLDDGMLALSLLLLGFPLLSLALRSKQPALAQTLALVQLASLGLCVLLQFAIDRPRPLDVRLLIPGPTVASWPSGHAAIAFASATTLSLAGRRPLPWFVLASLIAISRVSLGHHYPSDVVAGAAIGLALALAVHHWRRQQRAVAMLWLHSVGLALIVQLAWLDLLPRLFFLRWPGADKLMHALLFGVVSYWLRRVWAARWCGLPAAAVVVLGCAASEEALQALTPVRTTELADLLADVAGVGVAMWWASRGRR